MDAIQRYAPICLRSSLDNRSEVPLYDSTGEVKESISKRRLITSSSPSMGSECNQSQTFKFNRDNEVSYSPLMISRLPGRRRMICSPSSRRHVTLGVGLPVARQVSTASSPSWTAISVEDSSLMMSGGTAIKEERWSKIYPWSSIGQQCTLLEDSVGDCECVKWFTHYPTDW